MTSGRAASKASMRKWITMGCMALSAGLFSASLWAADFDPSNRPEVAAMINELVEQQHLSAASLESVMKQAKRSDAVLQAMSKPAEHHLRWDQYGRIFLQPLRAQQGAQFIAAHIDDFKRAEQVYGVPREIIAAIIGVETSYGRNTGSHRVIDSLSTLAFDYPPRATFFRQELKAYLTLTAKQHLDPLNQKGSYAGAIGYPQFMPSSYQAYAVDFNNDGKADLVNEPSDVIGSVANYFARHGWVNGIPVAIAATGPAKLPTGLPINSVAAPAVSEAQLQANGIRSKASLAANAKVTPIALDHEDGHYEYWLGTQNFYVITRYNHSHLYAMAVTELAVAIREALQRQ